MKWFVTVSLKIYGTDLYSRGGVGIWGVAGMHLLSLLCSRVSNYTSTFCLVVCCTTAARLHRFLHMDVCTFREKKNWWMFLIQDRVISIHRWSCLERNVMCWHLGLWVSTCTAAEWHKRKPANLFFAQCPTIHLLILPFSRLFLKELLHLGSLKAEKHPIPMHKWQFFSHLRRL